MEWHLLFPGLRAMARVGVLLPLLVSCANEGSGDGATSLDAALTDDASLPEDDEDAALPPDEVADASDELDADMGAETDAFTDIEEDAAVDLDGGAEADAEADAATPADADAAADASEEDAQSADAGPVCAQGTADCNGASTDGCEVDTTSSLENCNGCGQACSLNNAVPMCVASSCAVAACLPNYGDCNATAADGCEADTASDTQHCGGCNQPCSGRANASTSCTNGTCTLTGCSPSFANCNFNAADGCEINVTNDVRHCGGCGFACTAPNGTPSCSGRTCTIAACNGGFADCNAFPVDGCEVDTRSNSMHCGGCNMPCAAGLSCVQSTCR